ncbi:MAG: DEAD/DEAH box helicase family protein [Myxococcales bacterium]|nr:DEAD/DEAH box helicase family protein [Myxococcales bacterium]MBK7192712.1 DEAD/DEAH box helicase family protein [Myxococcales bacterium]
MSASRAAHPIQRLYLAEDLVRRRRADEHRRYAASQRAARIDPNPHQIDAVIFALARLPDGGCILADEVGLGKTIEAGLVIAQLRAEGARRILVVTPKALLGQWRQELFALFGIDAREVARGDALAFEGEGVFLATRDHVGSEAGAQLLEAGERFDLCVVDEAHEVFASIYKRFDRGGSIRDDSPYAKMAARLSQALGRAATPVLLLTATPLQNSLLELWGLVHFVDPTGTLLGDLPTFRDLFCPSDHRVLAAGQEHELQRRLETVLQRTLRRQAQEFMREPFMKRRAQLFEYTMSPEERALYDGVTKYLLEPSLFAFRGSQRTLLLIGFHRRMASSLAALSASLERVAERLRNLLERRPDDALAERAETLGDLEDDEEVTDQATAAVTATDTPAIAAELARVESFVARAGALPTDSKARALLRAVKLVFEQAEAGKSSGKLVIFTESLTTQEYLGRLLRQSHLVAEGEITFFRGTNDSPAAMRALDRWQEEVGRKLPAASRPSPDVAVRLALVHEFRTRSRVLISTEAGAKGLNLQFCDTVVNYDLPWNPQRIEQRIGRCHRYAQQRDVTVINFLATDNEAQRLTYEILSQKLHLFGAVLGATDEVLDEGGASAPESLASAVGVDFEAQLRRIYERSRTLEEVEHEVRELRASIDSKLREFEAAQRRTADAIQRRFDSSVKRSFRQIQEDLPRELAEFDRQVERVVVSYLETEGISHRLERRAGVVELAVDGSPALPLALREGTACLIGDPSPGTPLAPLHLGHPLVAAALAATRAGALGRRFAVRVEARDDDARALRGRHGRLRLVRVVTRGFEVSERLLAVVLLDGDDTPLPPDFALRLLDGPMKDAPARPERAAPTDAALTDAVDEVLFHDTGAAGAHEQPRFERTLEQIERFVNDRVLLLERQRAQALERLGKAQAARETAMGAEQRARVERALVAAQTDLDRFDAEIARLRAGDDENYQRWRRHTEARRYAKPEVEHLLDAELEIA